MLDVEMMTTMKTNKKEIPCKSCGRLPRMDTVGDPVNGLYEYGCPREKDTCVTVSGKNMFILIDAWDKINSKIVSEEAA